MAKMNNLWFIALAVIAVLVAVSVNVVERRGAQGGSDVSAPELKSLTFEPASIDTTNSARFVTVTLVLEDETGVCAKICSGDIPTQIMLQHVGSTQSQWASEFELVSGSFTDGVFEDDLVFPQGSAEGTWEVGFFRLIDNLGNFIDLDSTDLTGMGFPSYIVNGSGGPTPTPQPTPTPLPTASPTVSPSPVAGVRADVDCDGDTDAVDALAILLYIAGLDDLPVC